MKHQIRLSNGQVLQIEEGENALSIAAMHKGDVDAYICQINADGVLTYPNSGPAGEYLAQGLGKETEEQRTSIADGKLCYTLDGQNWMPAPDGMNVMLEDALIPGEERGDLVFHFTNEGLITDAWQEKDGATNNAGTSSQTYDDILDRLIEDNS